MRVVLVEVVVAVGGAGPLAIVLLLLLEGLGNDRSNLLLIHLETNKM